MAEDARVEAWRSEFWKGFEYILRNFFDPFLGDLKARWTIDSRDERSVVYAGTKLQVTMEDCSPERMRVRVMHVVPWSDVTEPHMYECSPLVDPNPVSLDKGHPFSDYMAGTAKIWICYMLLARLLSADYAVRADSQDERLHLIISKRWGPSCIKLRLCAVLAYDRSVFVSVHFFERVYLGFTANPKPLERPLQMADARELWGFIQTQLDTPWSSWPWTGPRVSLATLQRMPMMELSNAGKKVI
jgi:hypothetical protein